MHLCHLLSLLCENARRKFVKSSELFPALLFTFQHASSFPWHWYHYAFVKGRLSLQGPLLCVTFGSKFCHWGLLISSVCYCTFWHSVNSVHPLLWCSFQPLNVETMTEILDQSILWMTGNTTLWLFTRTEGISSPHLPRLRSRPVVPPGTALTSLVQRHERKLKKTSPMF